MKIFNFELKTLKDIPKQVTVSLIVLFVVDIFRKLKNYLPAAGSNLLKYISHTIIRNAATRTGVSLIDFFYVLIILPVLLVFIFLLFVSSYNWYKQSKQMKKLDGSDNILYSKTKKEIKDCKKNAISTLVTAFIGIFCLLEISFISYFPVALREQFDLKLKRIAPYTTEETIQKLESDWTIMKTNEDYSAIDSVISEIEEENNLRRD
ncbi:MAG: hypothetical protein K6G18_09425 [Treponema sp.]|nr:hypothetical protein [Treponema sp.]